MRWLVSNIQSLPAGVTLMPYLRLIADSGQDGEGEDGGVGSGILPGTESEGVRGREGKFSQRLASTWKRMHLTLDGGRMHLSRRFKRGRLSKYTTVGRAAGVFIRSVS